MKTQAGFPEKNKGSWRVVVALGLCWSGGRRTMRLMPTIFTNKTKLSGHVEKC